MAGYSGTPLVRKLGIKPNSELAIINEPKGYRNLIVPIPAGVRIKSKATVKTDLVHIFPTNKKELTRVLKSLLKQTAPKVSIWVSWPKKSSGIVSEVTEDIIREIALPLGLVDIKVCAVDETWSALKLVLRKEKRANKSLKPSPEVRL